MFKSAFLTHSIFFLNLSLFSDFLLVENSSLAWSEELAKESIVSKKAITETGSLKNPLEIRISPGDDGKNREKSDLNLSAPSSAAEIPRSTTRPPAAIIEPIPTEFFRPLLSRTIKENRIRVMVSGKTIPGATVIVPKKKISYLTANQKLKYLNLDEVLVDSNEAIANDEGVFFLNFDLPPENFQITLKISKPKSEVSQFFQLNFAVTEQESRISDLDGLKEGPLNAKRYAVWLGSGFNFLLYEQESSEIQSHIEFQTFKGPSFFGKGWWKINERIDASIEAKRSPGSIESASEIRNFSENHDWTIFAFESTYYPQNWRTTLYGKPSRWGVRAGLQHHIVPFISRTGVSETSFEVVTNSLSMLTIGFQNNVDISSRWLFEWLMRYQWPLIAGSVFQILPNFGFDGSVGFVRALQRNWKLGFYWYGQWHDYSFVHNDQYLINQGDPGPAIKGHQMLFFSNTEVRVGFEFN